MYVGLIISGQEIRLISMAFLRTMPSPALSSPSHSSSSNTKVPDPVACRSSQFVVQKRELYLAYDTLCRLLT